MRSPSGDTSKSLADDLGNVQLLITYLWITHNTQIVVE